MLMAKYLIANINTLILWFAIMIVAGAGAYHFLLAFNLDYKDDLYVDALIEAIVLYALIML